MKRNINELGIFLGRANTKKPNTQKNWLIIGSPGSVKSWKALERQVPKTSERKNQ